MIDGGDADGARALLLCPGNCGEARHGLDDQVLPGPVDIGPVRAEARSRSVNNVGLELANVVMAQSQFRHDTRAVILGDDIRAGNELAGDGDAFGALEVQGKAALVPVAGELQHCLAIDVPVGPTPFPLESPIYGLDGDHIRPKISQELYADGTHQEVVEADDLYALEMVHRFSSW